MKNAALKIDSINTTSKQQVLGLALAIITLFIWSGNLLSLRVGTQTPLTLNELCLFRYALPAIVLFPIFLKSLKEYAKVPLIYLIGIILGSGLPFFLLSGYGLKLAPVAYGGTLLPGTIPLFVSLLAVIVYKQLLPRYRKWGLVTICIGVVVMLGEAGSVWNTELLMGQICFLLSAFLWAIFTISIRFSGLSLIKVTALISLPNGIFITLWILSTNPQLGYMNLPLSELLSQMLIQGIIVGIFSGVCYGMAVVRIGAEKTAALGAATPVLATFLALITLNEQVTYILALGMGIVICGVFLASGVLHGEKTS